MNSETNACRDRESRAPENQMFERSGKRACCVLALAASLSVACSVRAASFKVLYSFPTNSWRSTTLVQGSDGFLYGTTLTGGTDGNGSVYRVRADGVFSNLFSFSYTNGAFPSPLLLGKDGSFYGVTSGGGWGWGYGTIFRMSADGTLTTLTYFAGTNGANPLGRLIEGSDGYFYGTTAAGGVNNNRSIYGDGTVFRVSTNGVLTSLACFAGTNGWAPYAGLVEGRDGAFYGTTPYGGPYTNPLPTVDGYGTIFKVTTNGMLTPLVFFADTNGAYPSAPLFAGRDGMFYGTAESGGSAGWGTVYRVSATGELTTLVNFDRDSTGVYPEAGLVEGSDGALYGTTTQGTFAPGRFGGTVFRVTTNGWFSSLYSFAEADGRWPDMAMTLGLDGAIYGTSIYGGGPENSGTVFRLDFVPQLLPLQPLVNGIRVSLAGLPATTHQVLRAPRPLGPWTAMESLTADTNGVATWVDTSPPPGQAFYRTAIPQRSLY